MQDNRYFAIARIVGSIVGFITFAGSWIYCISTYGFLLGVGLAWPLIALVIIGMIVVSADSKKAHAEALAEAAFSPSPEAIQLVEHTIDQAEYSIDVAAYYFTSQEIAAELIKAHQRGVDVRVLLDKGQAKHHHRAIEEMQAADIPIRVNARYAIMHDKYIIIDDKIVETGSFNYTEGAEKRNAENVIVINSQDLAREYMVNWQKLWAEGEAK